MTVQPAPSLSDWNWAVLMLGQAMLGAISPNFRLVELDFQNRRWIVRVTLRNDDIADREEVAEICDDFSIFMEDVRASISPQAYVAATPEVIVSAAPIVLDSTRRARPIFRTRES